MTLYQSHLISQNFIPNPNYITFSIRENNFVVNNTVFYAHLVQLLPGPILHLVSFMTNITQDLVIGTRVRVIQTRVKVIQSSQCKWLTKVITANKGCKHPEPITCPFCGCCLCIKEVVTDTPTTDTLVSETSKADNKNQSLPATQRLTETKSNYHKQRKPRRPFKRNTWSVWTREFPLSNKLSGNSHKTTLCNPTDKKRSSGLQ